MKGTTIHLKEDSLLQGGKYRIVRFINSGGFGCTYEAEHMMLCKRVAIKEFFVKDFCGRDERTAYVTIGTTNKKELVGKLKKKFIEEARSIFELHHPGIVRVTDVFEENDTAYYVMDYIEGKSLKEIVDNEGALPESRALGYIRQVSDALNYVHAHNRLHLDIKPGNIMIDGNDCAILIDFGTSKQYDEVNGENTSTLLGQTPGYAPPEQVGNDLVKFTPATDIYALGATLYKLLSGVTPISSTLRNSGDKLAPLPKSIRTSTCKTVDSAMKLNRHERIQSVPKFLDTLEKTGTDHWFKLGYLYGKLKKTNIPIMKKVLILIIIIAAIWGGYEWFYWEYYYPNYILPNEEENEVIEEPLIFPDDNEISITGTINGHDFVDLGLSVKWATKNVGAKKPSDYGDYFAWGEINPKHEYTIENCKTNYQEIFNICGDMNYDAARYHWGASWRLPKIEELEELKEKCIWEWTSMNEHNGFKVTGPNGNSMFLPASGWWFKTDVWNGLVYLGEEGNIYCGDFPDDEGPQRVGGTVMGWCLEFEEGDISIVGGSRSAGRSIRPVAEI